MQETKVFTKAKECWWVLEVKSKSTGNTVSVHITRHSPDEGVYGFDRLDQLENEYGPDYEVWKDDSYWNKKIAFDRKHYLQMQIQEITDRQRGNEFKK